jgi:hypothetical protein
MITVKPPEAIAVAKNEALELRPVYLKSAPLRERM